VCLISDEGSCRTFKFWVTRCERLPLSGKTMQRFSALPRLLSAPALTHKRAAPKEASCSAQSTLPSLSPAPDVCPSACCSQGQNLTYNSAPSQLSSAHSATTQLTTTSPQPCPPFALPFPCCSQGQKLSYNSISALIYTLCMVLGYRSHPTVPPDQEMLMGAR